MSYFLPFISRSCRDYYHASWFHCQNVTECPHAAREGVRLQLQLRICSTDSSVQFTAGDPTAARFRVETKTFNMVNLNEIWNYYVFMNQKRQDQNDEIN
jgi:hypothetical protein